MLPTKKFMSMENGESCSDDLALCTRTYVHTYILYI